MQPDFAQFLSIFMVEAVGVTNYFNGFLNYVGMVAVDVPEGFTFIEVDAVFGLSGVYSFHCFLVP